jgi:hypothetical protein
VEVELRQKVPMELGQWGSVGTVAATVTAAAVAAQEKVVGVGAGTGTLRLKDQLRGSGEQPQCTYVARGEGGRQDTGASTRTAAAAAAAAAGGRPSNFLRLALLAPAPGVAHARCTAVGTPSSGRYGMTRPVMAGANCCRTPRPAAPIRLVQGGQRTVAQAEGAAVVAAGGSDSALRKQQKLLLVVRCVAVECSDRELEKEYDC